MKSKPNKSQRFCGWGWVVNCGIISEKLLETKVWEIARENYIKSKNLTKEMIMAIKAKDRFISMISHEIRNPFNTLKGSVDYLMQVEKNPNHMKVLRNLLNNVLDAAKFKSDKIEIHQSQTSFVEIVRKVFMNSGLLGIKS